MMLVKEPLGAEHTNGLVARPLPGQMCRARIDACVPPTAVVGSPLLLVAHVRNLGPAVLASVAPHAVHVSYRWIDVASGRRLADDASLRACLPEPVHPDQTVACPVRIMPPETPGEYLLTLTLVQEHVAWFDDLDAANALQLVVHVSAVEATQTLPQPALASRHGGAPAESTPGVSLDTLLHDIDIAVRLEAEARALLMEQGERLVRHETRAALRVTDLDAAPGELLGADAPAPHALPAATVQSPYIQMVDAVCALAGRVTPAGARILVIDKGDDRLLRIDGRTAWSFPRGEDGTYAGHYPPDGSAAVEHLEALRADGAEYLLVPETASWWLEHGLYAEFRAHLDARYPRVWDDGRTVLFSLHEQHGPAPAAPADGVPAPFAAAYELHPVEPPSNWSLGQARACYVAVTNLGTETWMASGERPVCLGAHFGGESDHAEDGWATNQRFALPTDVAPGQTVTCCIRVVAPSAAGQYLLRYRLVWENVAWCDDLVKLRVTVGPAAESGQPTADGIAAIPEASSPAHDDGGEPEVAEPSKHPQYLRLIEALHEVLYGATPAGSCLLVVSKGDEQLVQMADRVGWHFPRDVSGAYAGYHPADGEAAVAHLEELRAEGAEHLVFPSTAFWWLEDAQYAAFRLHLDTHYRRIWNDERCVIYSLTDDAPTTRRDGAGSGSLWGRIWRTLTGS